MKYIFLIFYKYIKRNSHQDIAYDLYIDRGTVSEYSGFVRKAICNYVYTNSEKIGGLNADGTRKIVEIDESLFFKRKYNRGRITVGQWYIGGVERESKKAFVVPVANISAATINHIISEYIEPGCLIITNQWRAYALVLQNNDDHEHRNVYISINFVDPEIPAVHTQTIEGLWSHMKRFLRGKVGISNENYSEYLIQFLWEHKTEKTLRFNTFLLILQINF
ncbi:hypothetical protein DMUE_5629 [Dictyocoela muelleri]|nr:hypothetical protein DMUE_5629 [Dictyocoela muelleri]